MNKLKLFAAIGLSLLVFAGCGEPAAPGKYAEVAKCLADKGVTMYGAYWCPHCANQKKSFGSDFQFVKYQECDDKGQGGNHKACVEAGVQSYPTWFFPGQGNLVGEQQVRDLAKVGNCIEKLPQEDQDLLKKEDVTVTATDAKTPETPTTETPAAATTK